MKKVYSVFINSILSIAICFGLIYIMYKFLFPFSIAILLAILLEPIVNFLEKKMGLKRWIASLLSIITSFSFIFIGIILFSHKLIEEILVVTKTSQFSILINEILNSFNILRNKTINLIPQSEFINLEAEFNKLIQYFINELLIAKDYIISFLSAVPRFFLSFIIIVITTYFVSKDKIKISKALEKVLPSTNNNTYLTLKKIINTLFFIIKTELYLVFIFTILTIIGLYLLQVKYSVLLGIICGVLDLIPVIGPSIIFIPWILYSFIVSKNIVFALALLIFYLLLIVLKQLVQAKLMSTNLGLHPVLFLVGVYTGMKFFGIIGIIIVPFMFIIAKEIILTNLQRRN